ncbi:MAG TPA: HisA/HisF-related TIM barrel protein [Vicinamibacterales bacterium]
MLIPSIDLQDGRVVQLEQGERLAYASDDLDGWLQRFASAALVQVIDLDAAMGRGQNADLVRTICGRRACQVGGGIRSTAAAEAILASGATRVIVGSALFDDRGVNLQKAEQFGRALGADALVAAVDSRAGRVVTAGWRLSLEVSPVEAVKQLEPFAGAFLYTHVDGEGLLGGLNMTAVLEIHRATRRGLIAAGGIRHRDEVTALHLLGIDAVVGMAIYRGLMTPG